LIRFLFGFCGLRTWIAGLNLSNGERRGHGSGRRHGLNGVEFPASKLPENVSREGFIFTISKKWPLQRPNNNT